MSTHQQEQPKRGGRPRTRPPITSKAAIDLVCRRLIQGMSMAQACATPDVPAASEIYLRMSRDEVFQSKIAQARASQQHAEVDRTVDMADGATAEDWQAVRLRIWARQWRAGKLLPKVYGDKLLHTGADGEGPIAVKLALDYSLLDVHELVQLRALIDKATPKRIEAIAAPEIEGEAEEGDDGV